VDAQEASVSAKTTFALLAVFLLLCLSYFGLIQYREYAAERRAEAQRLFTLAPEEIEKISIQQENRPPTVGLRRGGEWRIVEPRELEAHDPLWERVARNFAEAGEQRIISEGGDLELYGLHAPTLAVRAWGEDGEENLFEFGIMGPTQQSRYARVNQGPIVLIDENVFFELNRDLDLLRRFHVFETGGRPISRIEFAWIYQDRQEDQIDAEQDQKRPDPGDESRPVVLKRTEQGEWRVAAPHEGPADDGRIEAMLEPLGSETAQDFIDNPEALSDYGLDPASARLSVWVEGVDEPQTLLTGHVLGEGPDDRMYAKWAERPGVFTVRQVMRNYFPPTMTWFNDRRLFAHSFEEANRLEFSLPDQSFALVREGNGWRLEGEAADRTDQAAVTEFLNAFSRLEAAGFLDAPNEAFRQPQVDLRVHLDGEAKPLRVVVGERIEGTQAFYARQSTGDSVAVPRDQLQPLLDLERFQFVDNRLMRFDEEELRRFELFFEGERYVFERPAEQWRVMQPEGASWDAPGDMAALLDIFDPVRASGLVSEDSPADAAEYGLEPPVLRARAGDGPVLQVGSLIPEESRRRYAVAGDRDGLYSVRQRLFDDLRRALDGLERP
jgi:hypothetical protein